MPEVLQDDVVVKVYMCLCFKWLGSNTIYSIDPPAAMRHPSGYALKFWSGTDFRADGGSTPCSICKHKTLQ